MNRPIGVFDSGIGGLTILNELATSLPLEDFVYFADCHNAPYGCKSTEEIQILSSRIIDFLLAKKCKLIVIACNTATAAAVDSLRNKYNVPIVGLEPAVKPACLASKTGNIGVLATEGTFRGDHFKNTSEKYKKYVSIHLEIAKGLVELAEKGLFEGQIVQKIVKEYTLFFDDKNIDFLVLGCTHYPLFFKTIRENLKPQINIIDSAKPVANRTKDLLMTNNLLCTKNPNRKINIFASENIEVINKTISKFFSSEMDIEIHNINNI